MKIITFLSLIFAVAIASSHLPDFSAPSGAIFHVENAAEAQALVDVGEDVNQRDLWKVTPLHWVVFHDRLEVAQFLLENGAQVNARDENGNTPLHKVRSVAMVQLLHKFGADVRAVNNDGASVYFNFTLRGLLMSGDSLTSEVRGIRRELKNRGAGWVAGVKMAMNRCAAALQFQSP